MTSSRIEPATYGMLVSVRLRADPRTAVATACTSRCRTGRNTSQPRITDHGSRITDSPRAAPAERASGLGVDLRVGPHEPKVHIRHRCRLRSSDLAYSSTLEMGQMFLRNVVSLTKGYTARSLAMLLLQGGG
jgi:hypothetical protein